MSDLKPCPYCGAVAINTIPNIRVYEMEHTQGCFLKGWGGWGGDGEEDGAVDFHPYNIDEWNTRADQWQPIETAPKDGTLFLAYEKGEEMAVMEWSRRCNSFRVCADTEWFSCLHPTHWMPLPVPPVNHSEDMRDMVKTAENKEKS